MTLPHWLSASFKGGVPRRSIIVALIVGPILTLINQGDSIVAGEGINWTKVGLTFLVPYMVATVGAVAALHGKETPQNLSTAGRDSCQPNAPKLSSARESPVQTGGFSLKARVHVTLKAGVLDPQGKAIENALASLGFNGVENVRQGKVIEFTLPEHDPDLARKSVEAMCEKLLANTVIENYAIELEA